MKKQHLAYLLAGVLVAPMARADNVTAHNTVGLLQAQLVTKTLMPVGVVEIWNTQMDMNLIVTPYSGLVLSKIWIYMDTEPAPPPVPDWYEAELAALQASLDEFRALLDACLALLEQDPENPQLLAEYASLLAEQEAVSEEYDALLAEYEALNVPPDFGEWPFTEKFKKLRPESYSLNVKLADLQYLQWGQWGEPWLQKRLVTIAVRVELKTTTTDPLELTWLGGIPEAQVMLDGSETMPNTFTAWAINPNLPLEGQCTSWGDNAYAFRYELQHPKQGHFVPGPVNGLTYRTVTHEGTTGVGGGFWYYPGEYVGLSIGSIDIGYAKADTRITPLDIFVSSEPSDAAVVNMMRVLMSLDADGDANGSIDINEASIAVLEGRVSALGLSEIDFTNTDEIDSLIASPLLAVTDTEAQALLEETTGSLVMRRNISKSPEYAVDKPKLDIIPVWVPAKTASGDPTTVVYRDEEGSVIEERDRVKPLMVTYTEAQEPDPEKGIVRSGSDVITAISVDDGATWKRFNVSHMAGKSSFTLESGEKFPGHCVGPQQKIVDDNLLVVWTSAYARGGKPRYTIKLDDGYGNDDPYAVNDIWGVRGRQGSVNYDENKDVGDQGIGEIPYYALWACRGVLIWEGNIEEYADWDVSEGDVLWFKPERLTSARRDAFFPNLGGTKNVGFAIAWQEDPGGLLPGSLKGGGDGWSGATVHKKTDIWYSYISLSDSALIDPDFVAETHANDEYGTDEHGLQPEISNRPKWLVPMSLPVRISDNNTVNTDNLRVERDPETGLPLPGYVPLEGALEEDYLASEHEKDGDCEEETDEDDDGHNGIGGGWGMARYAYLMPELGLVDFTGSTAIWEQTVDGEYRPDPGIRWFRFINKAGAEKTVAVTSDGRPLDGDTGACRPHLTLMSGGYAILGYEETKGLGVPPEGQHEDEVVDRPEPDDSGKNVIYHSFKFDAPDLVSAGNVLNLPALDDDGNLIPIYYKDAAGEPTTHFRQFKTENARRFRALSQPKSQMGASRTVMVATYKQGREGSGKPSDIFMIRAVVPESDGKADNPYRFSNLVRLDTSTPNPDENGYNRYQRKHMNMSAATVEEMDPFQVAMDAEGNSWNKVGKWKQYQGNLADESFSNPYSDAKGHRGFIRGDRIVFGYSFTPNWGRLGGDHMDFYVRRSFDGGQTWTTDPDGPEETVHTVIDRDVLTGEYSERQYAYGRGAFEPGRNVSLLKGNSHTVTDPRLVPPMGEGSTVNPTYPADDTGSEDTFYVVFGTGKVLHGLGEPLGETDIEKEDLFYTRTTDNGSTWYQVPWVINPDSASPDAGETVYRWPWLAQGTPHQGHAQVRMHPSGKRFYAIWHQWADGDELHLSPHDVGDDIWFRRIDFMGD